MYIKEKPRLSSPQRLARTCIAILLLHGACGTGPEDGGQLEAITKPLASLGIERTIPVRFVQISVSSSGFLSDLQLRRQIEGVNSVYKAAGIQFFISGEHNVVDAQLANPSITATPTYAWPNPVSSAAPIVFNPNCSFAHPAQESPVANALWRAAFLCGLDGEVLVYVLDNYETNTGAFPGNGKGILMIRSAMAQPAFVFAHEMGHYLGLNHAFDGFLTDAEIRASRQAAAWDLVYLPRSVVSPFSAANKVFNTREEAEPYEGKLLPIKQPDSQNCVFCNPTQAGNPCPSNYAEGTLKCTVSTGLSSPATETWFTGDPRMRGVGFVSTTVNPGGTTDRMYNVMDYPPGIARTPSHPYLFSISESQIASIRKQLRYEVYVSHPDPTMSGMPSGRPRLGLHSATPRWTEKLNVDGVGGRDIAIYEPFAGTFKVKPSGSSNAYSGSVLSTNLGSAGDIPMPGDYDGDGKIDYAIQTSNTAPGQPKNAFLRWCPSSVTVNQGGNKCARIEKMEWGSRDDVVVSDVNFDGDATTPEVAFYRPSTSEWFWGKIPKPVASAPAGQVTVVVTSINSIVYPGGTTAEPMLGLYDGDNKTDIALFDAPSHVFALRLSTENYQTLRIVQLPAPPSDRWPLALRGLKKSQSGNLALAAWYPGGLAYVVWNPASLPTSWTWGQGGAALTSNCSTVAADAVPVSGSIDVHNDGTSDIVQYYKSGDGTYGIFYITPIGADLSCQASYNVGVSGAGDAMKLVPFIVGDMKGDGRSELGVVNPDTQTWTFFPSDGVGYAGWNSFGFQFGGRDAQPL